MASVVWVEAGPLMMVTWVYQLKIMMSMDMKKDQLLLKMRQLSLV